MSTMGEFPNTLPDVSTITTNCLTRVYREVKPFSFMGSPSVRRSPCSMAAGEQYCGLVRSQQYSAGGGRAD